MDISVALNDNIWKPGELLTSLDISLGQNSMASSCLISLSDKDRSIAEKLIKHSLSAGGLQELQDNQTVTPTSSTPTSVTASSSTGVVTRGEGLTPNRLAFLDVLALKEVGGYFPNGFSEQWYYVYYTGGINPGFFSKEEASQGFPKSVGNRASGRYQFLASSWRDINTRLKGNFKDFLPESQDKAAILYLRDTRGALGKIDAGDIQGAIVAARGRWVSLPGGSQDGWGTNGMAKALQYYKERLTFYQGNNITPVTTVPKQEVKENTEVSKGSKITITWGEHTFTFYHQGTELDDNGITKVTGQSVRWIAGRRKRNTSHKDLSLKQLAQKIATSYGLQLSWEASFDPQYEHIDQTGITDYQLLHREASYAGLFVSDSDGKLTVKSRDKIKDTGLTLEPGKNLISYNIQDVPKDKNSKDISGLLQDENKAFVDPITGRTKLYSPDVDPSKSQGVTGNSSRPIAGTPKPGQDGQITQERARTTRIKGLPSTFICPLDATTLALRPMDAIRTKGISTSLDRIWFIDQVSFSTNNMTATLSCFSPIDTFQPASNNSNNSTTGDNTAPVPSEPTKDWVYPMSGTVTSVYGMRRGRLHRGTDIGSSSRRATIYAVASGKAFIRASGCRLGDSSCGGGFGNWVEIVHDNGYRTRYAHLTSISINNGQNVVKGQPIGVEGNTGASRGDHLHFEVVKDGNRIDPGTIFPKFRTTLASVIALAPIG